MNSVSLKPGYISVPSSTFSKERMHEKVANPSQFLPLTFPATKSILWDHRSIGKSSVVQLCQRRHPVVFLTEQTLRIVQRLVQEATSSELIFWLIGSVSTLEPDEGNVNITIASVDTSGKRSRTTKEITAKDLKPGEIIIPCAVSTNGTKPMCSEDDYLNSLQVVKNRCHSCSPIDIAQLLSIRANCSYERMGDRTNVHFDFNAVFPGVAFSVTPINPLPIVPTALSKNLGSPLSISEVQGEPKSGFLTMDHTRKLVLVFDSDRKIPTLPLVGIWASGIANVDDPFLWASMMRYTFGTNLKERVCLPPEPFLVVLYSVLCSKPEFYECTLESGTPHMDYTLAACHDVIQLNKNALGAEESPIEMELLPVTGGGQRMDVFYSALETFRNKVRAEENRNPGRADTAEEIVPRMFPVPVATQAMTAQPSVPEVTLLDVQTTGFLPTQEKRPQNVPVSYGTNPVEPSARSNATAYPRTTSQEQCEVQPRKPQRLSRGEDANGGWPVRGPAPFAYPGPTPSHPPPPAPSVHFQSQPQFAAPVPYAFTPNIYQPFPFQRPMMVSQEGHYMTPIPTSYGYPPQQPYGVNPSWAYSSVPLMTNVANSVRPSRPQSILRNPLPKPAGNQNKPGSPDWYQPINSRPNQVPGPSLVRSGLAQRPTIPRPASCVPSTFAATTRNPNTAQAMSNKRQSLHEEPQMPNTVQPAVNKRENLRAAEQQSRPKSQMVATKPAPFCQSPVDSHLQFDVPGSAHNSGSTDSGLQANDSSGLMESLSQSFPVNRGEVMQYLLHQQATIEDLQRQLNEFKANQVTVQAQLAKDDASKCSGPPASKSSSREMCSVAINTTQFWSTESSEGNAGRQSSNSSRTQKGKSDNSANGSCCSDPSPHGFRDGQGVKGGQSKQRVEHITSPRNPLQEESASFASVENMRRNSAHCSFDADMDANNLSFSDIHLSQIQIPNPNDECYASTMMILDMPDCTFFSPERDNTSHDTESNESPRNCNSVSPHEQDLASPIRTSHGSEFVAEDYGSRPMASDDLQRRRQEISSKASGRAGNYERCHYEPEPCPTAMHSSRNSDENRCNERMMNELDSRSRRCRDLGDDSSADDQTDVTTYSMDQSCLDQTFLPKINYVSMMLDSCSSSEMSMSADALAMKYLSDEQLSELAKLRSSTRPGREKVATVTKGRSDISMYGVQLSQMSFASQKYLERHGLLGNSSSSKESEPCKRVAARDGSGKNGYYGQEEISELKVQDFIQNLSKAKPRKSLGGGYNDSGSAAKQNGMLSSSVRSNVDRESFGECSSTPIHGRTAQGQPPVPNQNGERLAASGRTPQRRETYDGCPTPVAQNPAWLQSRDTPARTPTHPAASPSEPLPSSSKIRQRNVMAVDRTLDYTADVIMDSDEDPTDDRRHDVYSPVQQPSVDPQRTSPVVGSVDKVLDVKMIRELPKLL